MESDRAGIRLFVPLVLFGLSRAAAYLLRKVENEEETYFIVLLGILAGTALLAQFINLPGIVGSFLAGLPINAAVKDKPAKSKLEFMSNTLPTPSKVANSHNANKISGAIGVRPAPPS